MSKLTIERLSVADEPFAHTGINYFGSLLVKLNKKTRANQAFSKNKTLALKKREAVQAAIDVFWKWWLRKYLLTLTKRKRWRVEK